MPVVFEHLTTLTVKHNFLCFEEVTSPPLRANLFSPCINPVILLRNRGGYGGQAKPKHFLLLLQCLSWPAAGDGEYLKDPPLYAG